MNTASSIVLIAHGSPDPDWRQPIDAMAESLQAKVAPRTVRVAFLGCDPLLGAALDELHATGCRHVTVIPVLLSGGGKHLKRDVPQQVERLRQQYPDMEITLIHKALGGERRVIEALAHAAYDWLNDG